MLKVLVARAVFPEVVERLRTHFEVEDNPQDDETKVALAVSLLLGGDADWRHWIDNVLATSDDQPVREAALGVLSYVGSPQSVH